MTCRIGPSTRRADAAESLPKRLLGLLLAVGGALIVTAWPWVAPPEAPGEPADARSADAKAGTAEKKGRQAHRKIRRSLRMEEIEIYGEVEKPRTMFVIPQSAFQYSRRNREKDFTKEILDPITKEGVEDTQRWRTAEPPP